MKILRVSRDGGPNSPVTGLFIVEIKSLFSVVLLHFGGTREAFHSHAFNAVTLWLKGRVCECIKNGNEAYTQVWRAGDWKYTPRNLMHKILPGPGAWAISFRGPWAKTWQEFQDGKITTLAHGRKVVNEN